MKRFLFPVFLAAAVTAAAKTPIYYDVVRAQRNSSSPVYEVDRVVSHGTPAGLEFRYSRWDDGQNIDANEASSKNRTGYANYYRRVDLTPLGYSDSYKAIPFYAFKYGLNCNNSNYSMLPDRFYRSCAHAGSAFTRYLYPTGLMQEDCYFQVNSAPGSEGLEAMAISEHWDDAILTIGEVAKQGGNLLCVWQNYYVNYECQIDFLSNGGTGTMAAQAFTNACQGSVEEYQVGFYLSPNRFTKRGHRFVGWTDSVSGAAWADGAWVGPNTFTDDLTMTAQWEATNCWLQVEAEGGVGGTVQVNNENKGASWSGGYPYDSEVTLVAIADSAGGYSFKDWSDGETSASRSIRISDAGNRYVARFVRNTVIHFDKNSDSASGTMADQSFGYGVATVLNPNGFSCLYRRFAGWAESPTGPKKYDDGETVILYDGGTVNLYALWESCQVDVHFESNGGNPVTPSVKTVTAGDTYGELPVATRNAEPVGDLAMKYWIFGGWWTKTAGGDKVYASDVVTTTESDEYLYAHWSYVTSNNSYTISFDGNYDGCTQRFDDLEIRYLSRFPELPEATRDGYEFCGWSNQLYWAQYRKIEGNEYGVIRQGYQSYVTNAATFHAVWNPSNFRITLDPQGGAGGQTEVSVAYGAEVADLTDIPAREGYAFLSYTNADGTVAFDMAGVSQLGTWERTENLTVYARWKSTAEPARFTLTFDANGGDGLAEGTRTVTAGEDIGELPVPTRAGGVGKTWRFFGWYTAREGGAEITERTVCEADLTVYARWGIRELNDLLGAEELAMQYEGNREWSVDSATKYGSHASIWARGGDVLKTEERATVAVLTPSEGDIRFVYQFAKDVNNNDKFTYAADGGAGVELGIEFKDWTNLVANSVGESLRFSLLRQSEDEGDISRAWLAELGWTPAAAESPLHGWDSLAAFGDETAFARYGSGAWKVSALAHDRAEGENGLVAAGLGDARYAEVAFRTNEAGLVRFKWRTSCERGYCDGQGRYHCTDRLELRTNGVVVAMLDGQQADFSGYSLEVAADCEVGWRYVKDADGAEGEDKAWLDGFTFAPAGSPEAKGATEVTEEVPVAVPYDWLDEYSDGQLVTAEDYQRAAAQPSANPNGGGGCYSYWESYLAGLDPTNATSTFQTVISIDGGGEVVVSFSPSNAAANVVYEIRGKTNLTDRTWTRVTEGEGGNKDGMRFFQTAVDSVE